MRERDACGRCHVCCDAPSVEAFDKPCWKLCQHARKGRFGACSIYEDRPEECRTFSCAWLDNHDMPDEFRPDRCGIMLVGRPGTGKTTVQVWEDWTQLEGSRLESWLKENVDMEEFDWKKRIRPSNEPTESSNDQSEAEGTCMSRSSKS